MNIQTHKHYDKSWVKLTSREKRAALKAIQIFIEDPKNLKIRLHQLKGKFYPQYSISAGGDLRIHLIKSENSTLVAIGAHS